MRAFWAVLLLAGLVWLTGGVGAADEGAHFSEARNTAFDAAMTTAQSDLNLHSGAWAFAEDGEVFHAKAFGHHDGSREAITVETPFQLGSVSKSFAALVIVQLESEGHLSLDDRVVTHIPSFRTAQTELSNQITVRHLLSHQSGLSALDGNRYQFTSDRSPDATGKAVEKLRAVQLRFQPGTDFEYSNANYATLSHLIETVEGEPYEQVLQTRIFAPLDLDTCFVQVPSGADLNPVIGYRHFFGRRLAINSVPGRMMMGAGGVTCGVEDLVRYLEAVRTPDPAILTPEMQRALITPVETERMRYGLGWVEEDTPAGTVIYHNGQNGGFSAYAGFLKDRPVSFAFVTNASSYQHGGLQTGVAAAITGPVDEITPPRPQGRLALVAVTSIAALLFAGALRSAIRLFSGHYRPHHGRFGPYIPVIASAGLLMAIAFATLKFVPELNGITLRAMAVFFPDVAMVLLIAGGSAAVWAVTSTIGRLSAAARK